MVAGTGWEPVWTGWNHRVCASYPGSEIRPTSRFATGTRKSTSDPKILKSLDGTINMFIKMLETNFQPRGAQTAGSNLWRPRLDGFAPRRPKILSNTKEINGFPLWANQRKSEVKFDTLQRLEPAVCAPWGWKLVSNFVINMLMVPSSDFKIFGSEVGFLELILVKSPSKVGFCSKWSLLGICPDLRNFPGTFRGTRDHKK